MPRDLAVNAAKPRYPWVFESPVGTCAWWQSFTAHSLDSSPERAIHRPSGQDPMNAAASTTTVATASRNGDGVPMNAVLTRAEHDRLANAIRALAMDAVEHA